MITTNVAKDSLEWIDNGFDGGISQASQHLTVRIDFDLLVDIVLYNVVGFIPYFNDVMVVESKGYPSVAYLETSECSVGRGN